MKFEALFCIVMLAAAFIRSPGRSAEASDPTAHQVFADARDTNVLVRRTTWIGQDTNQVYVGFRSSYRFDSAYIRATYVKLFYFNNDGQRAYIPGAEYYR